MEAYVPQHTPVKVVLAGLHSCLRGRESSFHFQQGQPMSRLERWQAVGAGTFRTLWEFRTQVGASYEGEEERGLGLPAPACRTWMKPPHDRDYRAVVDAVRCNHRDMLEWMWSRTGEDGDASDPRGEDDLLQQWFGVDSFLRVSTHYLCDSYLVRTIAACFRADWAWGAHFLGYERVQAATHPDIVRQRDVEQGYRLARIVAIALSGHPDSLNRVLAVSDATPQCLPWLGQYPAFVDGVAAYARPEVIAWLLDHRAAERNGIDIAAGAGRLSVVELLHRRARQGSAQAVTNAAVGGHIHVLAFLKTNSIGGHGTTDILSQVARAGQLQAMEWLTQHHPATLGASYPTPEALDAAAGSGNLDLVEYMHFHRNDPASTEAMNLAAWRGSLDVVRFLHSHRSEGCTARALNLAAKEGHLRTVEWLAVHYAQTVRPSAATGTTSTWGGAGPHSRPLELAAMFGHINTVRFLHSRGVCPNITRRALYCGAKFPDIDEYLQPRFVLEVNTPATHECDIDTHH